MYKTVYFFNEGCVNRNFRELMFQFLKGELFFLRRKLLIIIPNSRFGRLFITNLFVLILDNILI